MSPLRGALVGFGFIADGGHLPAYRSFESAGNAGAPDFDIVAVADGCPARRALAHERLPHARIYADHRALLDAESSHLDFVDVCTPPVFHAPIASAALDLGLHVLCEKPLCVTPAEAHELVARALRAKRVLFPSHNYRHAPVVRAVRELLASGRIGDVHLATLQTFRTGHARGVTDWRPDWRREKSYAGGGIAMDHGAHTLYLAFEWLRGHPTSVSARTWTSPGFDTEDNITASFTFPTGVAMTQLTWTAGMRKVIYTLHGTHGALRIDDDAIEVFSASPGASPQTPREVTLLSAASNWMDARHTAWFRTLFQDFALAIENHNHVGADLRDAVRCVESIAGIYASNAEGGREVRLEVNPSIPQPAGASSNGSHERAHKVSDTTLSGLPRGG